MNVTPTGDFHLRGVDVFKYVMALAVVAIHVEYCFGLNFPQIVVWFDSLAVPFFFIVSGFLMARTLALKGNDSDRKTYLKGRTVKVLRLFLTWLAIYAPLTLVWGRFNHAGFTDYVLDNLVMIVTRGETELAYPLWFLYSLFLFTGALWLTADRKKWRSCVYMVALISYIGYFLSGRIDDNSAVVTAFVNYYPFRALSGGIFVLVGMTIYSHAHVFRKRFIVPILILLSFLMSIYKLPFYEIPGGCGLFLFSMLIRFKGNDRRFMDLRTSSMWIYYIHMYVIAFFLMAPLPDGPESPAAIYLAVVATTAVLAAVITYLQKKPSFALLDVLTR